MVGFQGRRRGIFLVTVWTGWSKGKSLGIWQVSNGICATLKNFHVVHRVSWQMPSNELWLFPTKSLSAHYVWLRTHVIRLSIARVVKSASSYKFAISLQLRYISGLEGLTGSIFCSVGTWKVLFHLFTSAYTRQSTHSFIHSFTCTYPYLFISLLYTYRSMYPCVCMCIFMNTYVPTLPIYLLLCLSYLNSIVHLFLSIFSSLSACLYVLPFTTATKQ